MLGIYMEKTLQNFEMGMEFFWAVPKKHKKYTNKLLHGKQKLLHS